MRVTLHPVETTHETKRSSRREYNVSKDMEHLTKTKYMTRVHGASRLAAAGTRTKILQLQPWTVNRSVMAFLGNIHHREWCHSRGSGITKPQGSYKQIGPLEPARCYHQREKITAPCSETRVFGLYDIHDPPHTALVPPWMKPDLT